MMSETAIPSSQRKWWRLPVLLALVLVAMWIWRDRSVRESAPDASDGVQSKASETPNGKTVSLAVDFGDGRRKEFEPIAWQRGMTVRDLTQEAPRQDKKLDVQGSGEMAFLAGLDGVANEGSDGRNWMYSVNGKAGDRSFAIYELSPGDEVLWTFAGQQ